MILLFRVIFQTDGIKHIKKNDFSLGFFKNIKLKKVVILKIYK